MKAACSPVIGDFGQVVMKAGRIATPSQSDFDDSDSDH